MTTLISVPADHEARLAALGLRGLRLPKQIAVYRDVALEPPSFVGGGLVLSLPLRIGAFTLINGGRIAKAHIGRYCSLASEVTIGSAEHPTDRITSSTLTFNTNFHGWDAFYDASRVEEFKAREVPFTKGRLLTTIGHDVWLGHGVFVKGGVTIGTGAIVGAGAVVTKDIPPYAIAVGVPAQVKRFRYPDAVIERLLASQWWTYALHDLLGEEIKDADRFLDKFEAMKAAGTIKPYAPAPITPEVLARALGASPAA